MQRRTFPGGIAALVPGNLESAGFLAAFTERSGGVTRGVFASLNMGLRSGDDPDLVRENRRRLLTALEVPPFACAHQVHGPRVVRIEASSAGAGFEDPSTGIAAADGLATAAEHVPLAVITADCVPLALADPGSGMVAVVHAGWRGIVAGVVKSALSLFPEPGRIRAAIGPAIGPDHYEVGGDVAHAVAAAVGGNGRIVRGEGSRRFLDLPGAVAHALRERGVPSIERADECTACEEARFFSHRRDGPCGRQALVAMRPS